MAPRFQNNPDRIAAFEAAGWRSYYDRKWLRLLGLIVSLSREQFHIPFPQSWFAAYYVTRASLAWAPLEHDTLVVQAFYEKFYRLARRYSGLHFDPARAAALELRYNDIHRRLVGNPDKREFLQAMTELHAEIFDLSLEQARESAEHRVKANNIVDLISNKLSTDIEGDWARLEAELRLCYWSIEAQMTAREKEHIPS
ncbi:MAG: hypothetical protein EXR62_08050 [Chloroflexi bacterium]|nr:hypothetical protein [Chloroflexota bacterium]